jgi:LPXTG-site transpeptidase (sortase) family protein
MRRMTRRTFLTVLLGGTATLAGLGCQTAPSRPAARRPDPTPTPAPTATPPPKPRPAPPTPQANPYTARTLPPSRLLIPRIELDSRVVQLTTRLDRNGKLVWETAAFAVGHHLGSANPGEVGNVVLSGHISSPSEGAIFKHLPELKPGDGVVVVTAEQHHLYRLTDRQVVEPSAVWAVEPTPFAALTLITCVPDGIYSHRLILRGEPV